MLNHLELRHFGPELPDQTRTEPLSFSLNVLQIRGPWFFQDGKAAPTRRVAKATSFSVEHTGRLTVDFQTSRLPECQALSCIQEDARRRSLAMHLQGPELMTSADFGDQPAGHGHKIWHFLRPQQWTSPDGGRFLAKHGQTHCFVELWVGIYEESLPPNLIELSLNLRPLVAEERRLAAWANIGSALRCSFLKDDDIAMLAKAMRYRKKFGHNVFSFVLI